MTIWSWESFIEAEGFEEAFLRIQLLIRVIRSHKCGLDPKKGLHSVREIIISSCNRYRVQAVTKSDATAPGLLCKGPVMPLWRSTKQRPFGFSLLCDILAVFTHGAFAGFHRALCAYEYTSFVFFSFLFIHFFSFSFFFFLFFYIPDGTSEEDLETVWELWSWSLLLSVDDWW